MFVGEYLNVLLCLFVSGQKLCFCAIIVAGCSKTTGCFQHREFHHEGASGPAGRVLGDSKNSTMDSLPKHVEINHLVSPVAMGAPTGHPTRTSWDYEFAASPP